MGPGDAFGPKLTGALAAVAAFPLPPDTGGSVKAFSRIGYDLFEALADLVDNSIDAGASRVEITFIRDDAAITSVTIADNGCGLPEADLREAMRFAGPRERSGRSLGVFGLGMKSASLSQCRSMTVLAKAKNTEVSGCRWTERSIRDGWRCEIVDSDSAATRFRASYAGPDGPGSGLVVLWEDLDRMAVAGGEEGLDEFLAQLLSQLDVRLGTIFHRFIGARFGIVLRAKHMGRTASLPRRVRAYDPFGYVETGRKGYPKTFVADLGEGTRLNLSAHIWPYGSTAPEFLLGRRRGTPHQGFYFYRNDRLLQSGGWHGVVRDTSDPELALARVAVDLPPGAVDSNVQKSSIQTTASLARALTRARAGQMAFEGYLEEARRVFRQTRRRPGPAHALPLVPGEGVPAGLRRYAERAAHGPARTIDFVWETLAQETVFEVDAGADRIVLNRLHRARLLGGARASGVDAPVVKTLLLLLLGPDLNSSRLSAARRSRLKEFNDLLVRAVKQS